MIFVFESFILQFLIWVPSESLETLYSLQQLNDLRFHLLILRFYFLYFRFRFFVLNHCSFEIRVSKYLPELLIGLLLNLSIEHPFVKDAQEDSEESGQDKQASDLSENALHSLALVGHHSHLVID